MGFNDYIRLYGVRREETLEETGEESSNKMDADDFKEYYEKGYRIGTFLKNMFLSTMAYIIVVRTAKLLKKLIERV